MVHDTFAFGGNDNDLFLLRKRHAHRSDINEGDTDMAWKFRQGLGTAHFIYLLSRVRYRMLG